MANFWKNLKSLIEYAEDGILSKVITKSSKLNVTLYYVLWQNKLGFDNAIIHLGTTLVQEHVIVLEQSQLVPSP